MWCGYYWEHLPRFILRIKEQTAQQNDKKIKCCDSGQKGSTSKAVDCKDKTKEISIAEKKQESRKTACGHYKKQQVSTLFSIETATVKDFTLRQKLWSTTFRCGSSKGNLFLRITFRVPRDPGTWLLQREKPDHCSGWPQTLTASMWSWLLAHAKCRNSGVKKASTHISEGLQPGSRPLRGQCVKVWGWKQSFSGDARSLEKQGMLIIWGSPWGESKTITREMLWSRDGTTQALWS